MPILAIDAFRTLFESVYFGAWYTSVVGFFPKYVHDFLVRPECVFVPKFLNVVAAILVIFIVLRHWLPKEEEEEERQEHKNYMIKLENEIVERKKSEREKGLLIADLKTVLDEINQLQELLPICAKCKRIRDEEGCWGQLESYIEKYTQSKFSHGLCEQCAEELYGNEDWYEGTDNANP